MNINVNTTPKVFRRLLGFTAILMGGVLTGTDATAQIGAPATITVNDTSVTPTGITAGATAFCTGGSTQLTVQGGKLGAGGATWQWYTGGCGTGTAINTGSSISVSPVNNGTSDITVVYYVRAEGGTCNHTSGCAQISITVHPKPTVVAPSNITYCNGASAPAIALSGTPSGIRYAISGGSAINLADASNLTEIPSFTPTNNSTAPVTATITITPSANGCPGDPVTYDITVLPAITVNTVASQAKCNGTSSDPIVFSSPAGASVTYSWTNSDPTIGIPASGNGDIPATVLTNGTCNDVEATFTVTPTYTVGGNLCPGTPATFKIKVRPTPNGSITGGTICEGTPAQLTFNATCGLAPFSLEIQPAGAPLMPPYNNIGNGASFNITPTPTTTTSYNLMKITDANGCVKQ